MLMSDDSPLVIELYGEAKETALRLAKREGAQPGDVVARALGSLDFHYKERDDGRRTITENTDGTDRRLLNIRVLPGDAGS